MTTLETEIAVIGGGLVGSAIGWGLARLGHSVAVFDEGDIAYRASRANFALVWVQSKGLGSTGCPRDPRDPRGKMFSFTQKNGPGHRPAEF